MTWSRGLGSRVGEGVPGKQLTLLNSAWYYASGRCWRQPALSVYFKFVGQGSSWPCLASVAAVVGHRAAAVGPESVGSAKKCHCA